MMFRGLKLYTALVLLCVAGAGQAQADEQKAYDRVIGSNTIKCGYISWPPYYDKNAATGELTGYSKELTDTVLKLLELKADYIEVTFGNQVQDLRSGKIDAMCGEGPWVTASAKYMDYTAPFYQIPLFIYGREGGKKFKSLSELDQKGVMFVGIDGDLSTTMAQLRFPKAGLKTLPGTSDPSIMMLDIADGKADIAIIDPLAVKKFNATNPKKIMPVFGKQIFASNKAGFAVAKGEAGLQSMLEEGIDAANRMGLIESITDKYDPDHTLLLRAPSPYRTYGE